MIFTLILFQSKNFVPLLVAKFYFRPDSFYTKMILNLKLFAVFLLLLLRCDASPTKQIPKDERDPAMENFLTHVMTNYTSWLFLTFRDPFKISDTVKLKGTKINGNVDVEVEIANQTMAQHSRLYNELIVTNSYLNDTLFVVARSTFQDPVVFWGDFSIKSGFYYDEPEPYKRVILGKGKWRLTAGSFSESMTFKGFTLTEEGYIDLSGANLAWVYLPQWSEIKFEGLMVSPGGVEHEGAVEKALAQVYSTFLLGRDPNGNRDLSPPRKLLLEYMKETVEMTKLEDIVANWMPTTTTPRYPRPSSSENLRAFPVFVTLLFFAKTLI